MALTVAQLAVNVQAEGADEAKHKLEGVSEATDHAKEHGDDFFKHMLEITGVVAAFELVKKGAEILGDQLGEIVQAGMRAQDTQAQLAAVLKSTGDASGYTADAANRLADSLSQTTRFSADANLRTEELLMTFTSIGKETFPTATKAVLDMSTALGEDTKSAAIQLGKALNDPIHGMTALKRVGVEFNDEQKKLIKGYQEHGELAKAQAVILQELQREFGGSAEAAGQTFAGKLAILNNQMDQTKEKIGAAVIPVLSQLLTAVTPAINAFGEWLPGAMKTLMPLLGLIGTAIANVVQGLKAGLGPGIQAVQQAFSGMGGPGLTFNDVLRKVSLAAQLAGTVAYQLGSVISAVASVIVTQVVPAVISLATWFRDHVLPVIQILAGVIVQNVLPALQRLWTAISENLLPAIERLLAKILPVLIPVFHLLGWVIQNVVGPALAGIITVIGHVIDWLATFIGKIGDVLGAIGGFIGAIGPAWSGFWSGIQKALQDAWNAIVTAVSTAIKTVIGWFQTAYDHSTVFKALVDAVVGYFTGLWHDIVAIAQTIGNVLKGAWETIVATAKVDWDLFVGVIGGILGAIGTAIGNIINAIKGPLGDLGGALLQIGQHIIQGLLDGMGSMLGAIGKKVGEVGGAIKDGLSNLLGIHSPSTVFAEIGRNLGQGLMLGLVGEDLPGQIAAHLARIGGSAVGGLSVGGLSVGVSGGMDGSGVLPLPYSAITGGGGGSGPLASTFIIQLDGRQIAQSTIQHMPGIVRLGTGLGI